MPIRRLTLIAALLACLMHPSHAADDKTYTVGIVPQFEANVLHGIWKPILSELEKRTGYQFTLVGSPAIPAFESEFLKGEFDIAYMNPYHLLLANEDQQYTPIIRDHGRKLQGVLVVRKDSKIDSIQDLQNEILAFPSPKALGASLQMRYELAQLHGITVKPKYVKTHDSVYLNVLLKQAKAGGGVQKTLNQQTAKIKDALRVIYRTKKVNPHPIVVHPRVPAKVRNALQQAILDMAATAEGRQLLAKIPMKKAGKATLSDYDDLKAMNLKRYH